MKTARLMAICLTLCASLSAGTVTLHFLGAGPSLLSAIIIVAGALIVVGMLRTWKAKP